MRVAPVLFLLVAMVAAAWGYQQTRSDKEPPAASQSKEKTGQKAEKPAKGTKPGAAPTKAAAKTNKPLLLLDEEPPAKTAKGAQKGSACVGPTKGQPGEKRQKPEKGAKPAATPTKSAAKTDKPLLLLDEEPEAKPAEGADNSRCHVCHINFAEEPLAVSHALAGVGCAKCHGPSDAHIDDESWTSGGKGTPPDIMYPAAKINAFCMTCHELDKNDPDLKCTFPGLKEKKVCTDCHGKHRLNSRKCKWK